MRIARSVTATSHSTVAFHSREPGETCDRNEMVAVGFSSKRYRRLRLATFLPFTAGVFLGTLITLFLVLSLRSIDGDTRSAESFRQRSAASLKMPSMPRGFRAEEKDTSGPSANTAIKTTPRVTAMAAYFVVVPGVELKTRGLAAHKTWASDLGKRVSFYLCPAGTTEEIDFAYKKRIPLVSLSSTGRSSSARESDGRTTSRGILRAWQDVCEREMGNYRWYVKVEDTSYVHPFRLESVLNALNSSEAHFIGHRVVPEGVEGEELGLREGESYCMELGYALSLGAMQRLCPMLKFCQNNARSENEDVELARCVGLSSGVNCTSAREMQDLFYKARTPLTEEELQQGDHRLNLNTRRALLLSPLTHSEHFYHLHYHYVREQLNTSRVAATRLRLRMIDAANMAAESITFAHYGIHQSPSWTRLGVKSPYHAPTVADVIHCQSFDSDYQYTEASQYPSHPLSHLAMSSIKSIIAAVSEKYSKSGFLINSLLQRVDPSRGIDYFIHTLQKDASGGYQSNFMHVLREAEPLRVTSLEQANYKTSKVNFIVPAPAASKAFQRFMMSYENTFLARSPPELVGLLVILYSDGKLRTYARNIFGTTTLLDLYKKKYPEADLRLITTHQPFSRKESIELASREYHSFELIFLADIHIDFSLQFLERCRLNSIENQQAYFPSVFNPHNPAAFYKYKVMHPYAIRFQLDREQGYWMTESYHLACLHNYDLMAVLELGRKLKEKEWSLIRLVVQYKRLGVFRAVEPGLVHLWQDGCSEEDLGSREKILCDRLGQVQ